jgi:hypothetical protein
MPPVGALLDARNITRALEFYPPFMHGEYGAVPSFSIKLSRRVQTNVRALIDDLKLLLTGIALRYDGDDLLC